MNTEKTVDMIVGKFFSHCCDSLEERMSEQNLFTKDILTNFAVQVCRRTKGETVSGVFVITADSAALYSDENMNPGLGGEFHFLDHCSGKYTGFDELDNFRTDGGIIASEIIQNNPEDTVPVALAFYFQNKENNEIKTMIKCMNMKGEPQQDYQFVKTDHYEINDLDATFESSIRKNQMTAFVEELGDSYTKYCLFKGCGIPADEYVQKFLDDEAFATQAGILTSYLYNPDSEFWKKEYQLFSLVMTTDTFCAPGKNNPVRSSSISQDCSDIFNLAKMYRLGGKAGNEFRNSYNETPFLIAVCRKEENDFAFRLNVEISDMNQNRCITTKVCFDKATHKTGMDADDFRIHLERIAADAPDEKSSEQVSKYIQGFKEQLQ